MKDKIITITCSEVIGGTQFNESTQVTYEMYYSEIDIVARIVNILRLKLAGKRKKIQDTNMPSVSSSNGEG